MRARFVLGCATLCAGAAGLLAGGAQGRTRALPTLYVAYAMSCTFTITNDAGAQVSSIAPGTYQVEVTTPVVFAAVDLTGVTDFTACKSFVQFQLSGPGVNLTTTLQDGDEDFGVFPETFLPSSTYTAVDNNQPSVARAAFTTLAGGSPTAAPNPTTPAPTSSSGGGSVVGSALPSTPATLALRGTLSAAVSAAGKATLRFKGKAVATLTAGRYTVSLVDGSKTNGFILQEIHHAATTLAKSGFAGKRSATVALTAGQWVFYSSFIGAKTYFIVIR